jgi:hypothetical protein
MKNTKGCLIYSSLFALTIVLVVLTLSLIYNLQQRWQTQLRSEYYKTILMQAPCISGVCPGFEGRDKVLDLLTNNEALEQIWQSPLYDSGGSASIGFSFANNSTNLRGGGHVLFTTNSHNQYEVVEKISLTPDYLALATVINALGEPDEVFFVAGCGGKGRRVHAKLFYRSLGVELNIQYATRRAFSQTITGDTRVAWIQYFSPENYQEHIIESLNFSIVDNTTAYTLPPSITIDALLQEIKPWTGFGVTPSVNLCTR